MSEGPVFQIVWDQMKVKERKGKKRQVDQWERGTFTTGKLGSCML